MAAGGSDEDEVPTKSEKHKGKRKLCVGLYTL